MSDQKITVELGPRSMKLLKRIATALDPEGDNVKISPEDVPKRLIEHGAESTDELKPETQKRYDTSATHADDEPSVRHFGSV